MGMDVIGKCAVPKPVGEDGKPVGEYFRNNVWWWRPLATYCVEVAPKITDGCAYWQSNDGDGLNAEDSVRLADALQAEVDSGRTAAYACDYKARLEALPLEQCSICDGTGWRTDGVLGPGKKKCNGCKGTGETKNSETWYPFTVENVIEWIAFLRFCGGFEIW